MTAVGPSQRQKRGNGPQPGGSKSDVVLYYGCATCRFSVGGCHRCNPDKYARWLGNQNAKTRARELASTKNKKAKGWGCSICNYKRDGCRNCSGQKLTEFKKDLRDALGFKGKIDDVTELLELQAEYHRLLSAGAKRAPAKRAKTKKAEGQKRKVSKTKGKVIAKKKKKSMRKQVKRNATWEAHKMPKWPLIDAKELESYEWIGTGAADLKPLPERRAKVVIVGAGVAGLTAARELERAGRFEVIVLEARGRIGGRIDTLKLPETQDRDGRTIPECPVDLGASYIHGCEDTHPIYALSKELQVRCDPSSSAETYMDTCVWLNHETGRRIGKIRIAKAHQVMYAAAKKIMETALEKRNRGDKDFALSEVFQQAVEHGIKQKKVASFDELDRRILHCAAKRAWQICADFSKLSGLQEASWLDEEAEKTEADEKTEAEAPGDEDPEVPKQEQVANGEAPLGHQAEGETEASGVAAPAVKEEDGGGEDDSKRRKRRKRSKKKQVTYHPTDRIVVDGYADFLIDHLRAGTSYELRLNTVVQQINSLPGSCVVTTSDRKRFHADYVLVTLPVGVLKATSERSRINFSPDLSDRKQRAIQTFGMGSENKVVLQFDPQDVFWPTKAPYFISTDDRFRFLNLDYYGKPGLLVVHGQPPFSWNWGGLTDAELVRELRACLAKIFDLDHTPEPLFTHVTRWDTDDFSLGSYSYFSVNSTTDTVQDLASCEGLAKEKRVHFAGEACSVDGHQCVHGAYSTGLEAAQAIAARYREDGEDLGPPNHGYGAPADPVTSVLCSVCDEWKDVNVSAKEFGRISKTKNWACSAACVIRSETRGLELCAPCQAWKDIFLKKSEGLLEYGEAGRGVACDNDGKGEGVSFRIGDRVIAPDWAHGNIYQAKVVDVNEGAGVYRVHYDGYKSKDDKWFPASCLRDFEGEGCTCQYRRFFKKA